MQTRQDEVAVELEGRSLLQVVRLAICGGLALFVFGLWHGPWFVPTMGAVSVLYGFNLYLRNFRVHRSYRRFRKALRRTAPEHERSLR